MSFPGCFKLICCETSILPLMVLENMQASMLEIYNETIRDLLSVNCSSGLDLARAENCGVGKQYAIKHDANGNTHVADLTIVDVCSMKEVSRLLRQAAQSR